MIQRLNRCQVSPQSWLWLILGLIRPLICLIWPVMQSVLFSARRLAKGKCHIYIHREFKSGLTSSERCLISSLHSFPFKAPAEFFFSCFLFHVFILRSSVFQYVATSCVSASGCSCCRDYWLYCGGINHKTDNFSDLWNGNTVILCL